MDGSIEPAMMIFMRKVHAPLEWHDEMGER